MSAFDDGGWLISRVVFASLAVAIATTPVGPTQVSVSADQRGRVAPGEAPGQPGTPPAWGKEQETSSEPAAQRA